jgi:penicillin-binding protein 2
VEASFDPLVSQPCDVHMAGESLQPCGQAHSEAVRIVRFTHNSKPTSALIRSVLFWFSLLLLSQAVLAATINTRSLVHKKPRTVTETAHARKRMRRLARSRAPAHRPAHVLNASMHRRHRYYEHFTTSSFSEDITEGDVTAGEDPVVRGAAIDALGNMNGTVVAIEPTSGRILAMVNQRLALSSGAQPCSTIKLSVALAALSEGLITKETEVRLGGRSHMNLTRALARSNNAYFEALGRQLGFERVKQYAREYGLGELAGYAIPG